VKSHQLGARLQTLVGGCFVEMPIPLKQGTVLKLGLWIKESKLWLNGKVVNSRPGFGIGIQFMDLSHEDIERLRQFLRSMARVPF
jgi:PilZ domain-containing protein